MELKMNDIEEANFLHKGIEEWIKQGPQKVKDAIRIGEILTKHRAKFPPRSGWLKFLEENFVFVQQTANDYMRLYEYRAILRDSRSINQATALIEGKGQRPKKISETPQQQWDRMERKELESDAKIEQRRAELVTIDGVVEFPTYQGEFDLFWEEIKAEYPREKQIEIALELIQYLCGRYPEITGESKFRVVEKI